VTIRDFSLLAHHKITGLNIRPVIFNINVRSMKELSVMIFGITTSLLEQQMP